MTHVGILQARALTFSPNGRLLAVAAEHIELLDAATGRHVRRLQGRRPKPAALAFSCDGKQLLSCSGPTSGRQDNGKEVVEPAELAMWDVASGKSVRRMALSADHELGSFCFSPGAALLAASHGGRKVRLWDAASGRELPSIPVEGSALAFSLDGKLLAVGCESLRLWDLGARKEVRSFAPAEKLIWQVLFSPDGKLLATREQARLHFWDIDRGREIVTDEGHNGAIAAIACSADGKLVLSGGADRSLCLWDAPAGKLLRRLEGHEAEVTTLALSPDGKRAASQDAAGRAIVWDAATGRRLRTLKLAVPPALRLGVWHTNVQKAAFSADGSVLLLADAAGVVRRWQVPSWKELHRLQTDEEALPPALSPDGKLLALSVDHHNQGAQVRMRESDAGSEKWHREYGPTGTTLAATSIQAMTFSPDGGLLAIGGVVYRTAGLGGIEGTQLTIHESATGKQVLALAHPFLPAVVAFSADGTMLAAATGAGPFAWMAGGTGANIPPCLWDVRSGEPVGVLAGHRGPVTDLAFSADGRTLFSAGVDGTILVWDVGRLPLRQPRRPHDLSAQQLRQAWDDLAGADAERALRAIADLSAVPAQVIPFLQARLHPAVVEDPARIAGLIADLDSEDFALRERATRQLTEKIDQVEPALRRALQGQPALETRRRLEGILRHLQTSGEQRRAWRVCLLLDWTDTPEADKLLRTLAGGASDARLTREARAALERRARRLAQ